MRMKAKAKNKSCCNVLAVYSLQHFSGREHFSGVLDGMAGTGDWQLETISPNLFLGRDALVNSEGEPYDGMIISMPGSDEVMEKIAKSRLPTVLVDIPDRTLAARYDAVSWVWTDNADIGRRAARHLLEHGEYAAAGYIHEVPDRFYSHERLTAFRQTMHESGCETSVFSPDGTTTARYLKSLRAWLKELPKPAAVMAASDMRAADVINACRAEGIAVPSKVAVIGVDCDVSQHARCGMSISSVILNSRMMGREAVRELEFLLRHPKYKGRVRESLIPAKEIFAGESTARSTTSARLVETAVKFINMNCTRPLSTNDIVAYLGCSRRLAELRFSQILGTTIHAAIAKARMEEARRLLHNGKSVDAVAKELQFSSANQLYQAYKRHFGCTIRSGRGLCKTGAPGGS